MGNFFSFLRIHWGGILMLWLSLGFLVFLLHWVTWIFGKGRFRPAEVVAPRQLNLRYIFSDAVVKIINDFRHLLALVIVFIFAFTLAYSMIRAGGNLAAMKDAIQVVVSTLGGLVGSIIGYYFGESAIIKAREGERSGEPMQVTTSPVVQGAAPPVQTTDAAAQPVRQAPPPPPEE